MSLFGNLTAKEVLRGRINRLDAIYISAYSVAVKNGFEGTEEEWLESLCCTTEQVDTAVAKYMASNPILKVTTVTLYAKNWADTDSGYSQAVTMNGVTPNSKIDPQLSPEQIADFVDNETSLVFGNDNGNVTAYIIGSKPEADLTIHVLIAEVYAV